MNKANNPEKIGNDVIVTLDYTVSVNGEVIDTSQGHDPIEFIQGRGQIIPGLERELYGMSTGESKEITVSPSDGYGEEDPDAFADIPKQEFPDEIPLKPGVELQLKNQEGEELQAYIYSVGEETIRLNFNHPLAGKELQFLVNVVGLREATTEELEHGHVHHGHSH